LGAGPDGEQPSLSINSLQSALAQRVSEGFARIQQDKAHFAPLVRVSERPDQWDFQADGALAAAKRLSLRPNDLAERLIAAMHSSGMVERMASSGPGFINFRLTNDYICRFLEDRLTQVIAGQINPPKRQRIVVDLSSPNLAKEMHVGHLRSTVIGDAVARVLGHLGHSVIRQNHVGDWGTQFGMLVTYMDSLGASATARLADLQDFYSRASKKFHSDEAFADAARATTLALHSNDQACIKLWSHFREVSWSHCSAVYKRLGVDLNEDNLRGESAYRNDLAQVVADCEKAGLVSESDGARCVFSEEIKGKDGRPLPLIIQKSDGAYLYATTDLAAIRYRADQLAADRVLYFVDVRQRLHFRQVFETARRAGFVREGMTLEHIPFGMITGADGKSLKTREGNTPRLNDLLDEAEARACSLVRAGNPELSSEQCEEIGRIVGVGAVKYADLSRNPLQDYAFSWNSMLSLEGNTGPYLQYAYARIAGIFERADDSLTGTTPLSALNEPAERALALELGNFGAAIEGVATKGHPHLLCNYLSSLASRFSKFYEDCPVLKSAPSTRNNRLRLCRLTADVLKAGLNLLGIQVAARM